MGCVYAIYKASKKKCQREHKTYTRFDTPTTPFCTPPTILKRSIVTSPSIILTPTQIAQSIKQIEAIQMQQSPRTQCIIAAQNINLSNLSGIDLVQLLSLNNTSFMDADKDVSFDIDEMDILQELQKEIDVKTENKHSSASTLSCSLTPIGSDSLTHF